MSSGCGDVLSLADLQTAKKHQIFEAEVITGKSGGVAGGADIDYATNAVTGQTQKTLPAVLRGAGFSPVSWDFSTGGTLTVNDRDKVVYDPVSKTWYSYAGTLPVTVHAGFNPVGNADWKPQTDPYLRSELAGPTGYMLVGAGESTVDQMLYHTPEEFATISASIDDAIDACLNACASDGKRAWLRNHYQIFRTIHVPIGVYVQFDGTIEIMADVDGVHLMRESKLIGGGTVTRSSTLASFTKTAVILYSPRNGRTIGCIDNQVSGIRIMNGWIDYSADSFGTVTDASKMTGRGLCVLAGSWGEGYTTEKSNEYCWKNKVNECFIEGFNTGLELRVYGDDDYTVWVNSNKFSQITFNRCVRNIRLENPGTTANGSLKVEVSANDFDQIDIQWYPNITTQYIFCSGRQNRFNFHAWDLPASVTSAVVVFQYQTPGAVSAAITFAQPRDNVVEITGLNTESTNRSCDRWGTWLYERFQGQNRIVTPGALTQYYVPEDVAPNTHSPLTNHYTATVDDCLLYSSRRKTNPTTTQLFVNGASTTITNAGRMFSPLIGDYATTPTLSTGDYFDLRVNFPSVANVRFAGFSFGELTWATSFTPRIRMYNSAGDVLYDRVFQQGNSIITGHIEINSVAYMTLSVTNITGSGSFPIARCFMKAANYGSSGFINPGMSTPFVDDVAIDKANGGILVWTPDGTKQYKISVSNAGSIIATQIT